MDNRKTLVNGYELHSFALSIKTWFQSEKCVYYDFLKLMGGERRIWFRLLTGKIYGIFLLNSSTVLGCCLLKKNYLNRYPFMGKNDWLVNPYYICADCRGHGLGKLLMSNITVSPESVLWAVVSSKNIASQKVLQATGFTSLCFVSEGWRHLPSLKRTDLILYRR